MSAAELQSCLGRLCVDASFRRLFELEGEATLAGYRLTAGEIEALRAIGARPLALFAGGLRVKRREQLERGYPRLLKVLDLREQDRWFDRYYDLGPADPAESPLEARVKFGRFLEASLAGDPDAPPYAAELARFERLRTAAMLPPAGGPGGGPPPRLDRRPARPPTAGARPALRPGVQRGAFRFDVLAIAAELDQDRVPERAPLLDHELLFVPPTGQGPPRIIRMNEAAGCLLDLCDGARTVRAIASAYRASSSRPARVEEVAAALGRYRDVGALSG